MCVEVVIQSYTNSLFSAREVNDFGITFAIKANFADVQASHPRSRRSCAALGAKPWSSSSRFTQQG